MCHVNYSGLRDLWCNSEFHVTTSLIATQWLHDKSRGSMMKSVGHTKKDV